MASCGTSSGILSKAVVGRLSTYTNIGSNSQHSPKPKTNNQQGALEHWKT